MFSLLNLIGLGGLIPSLGKIAVTLTDSLGPLLKGFSEALVWYVKVLWEGLKDVLDSVYTVVFVLSLCVLVGFYADKKADETCEVRVAQLQKQITALRKNPVKTYTPGPFDWLFR